MHQQKNENEPKKRYLIYTRTSAKSTLDSSEDSSIQLQVERCKQYIEHLGGIVVNVITDTAQSGASLNRPGIQKVLGELKAGLADWDGIVVFKLDRLSRSIMDTTEIIDQLAKNNKQLVSVCEHIDLTSAVGRFMVKMISILNEAERGGATEIAALMQQK